MFWVWHQWHQCHLAAGNRHSCYVIERFCIEATWLVHETLDAKLANKKFRFQIRIELNFSDLMPNVHKPVQDLHGFFQPCTIHSATFIQLAVIDFRNQKGGGVQEECPGKTSPQISGAWKQSRGVSTTPWPSLRSRKRCGIFWPRCQICKKWHMCQFVQNGDLSTHVTHVNFLRAPKKSKTLWHFNWHLGHRSSTTSKLLNIAFSTALKFRILTNHRVGKTPRFWTCCACCACCAPCACTRL